MAEGEVLDVSGQLATDFTGIVNPTVKDSKMTVTCLKNNNQDDSPAFTFTDYPNTIFIGNDSVRNGKFSFTFTVPKDISYSNLQGKMAMRHRVISTISLSEELPTRRKPIRSVRKSVPFT